MSKIESAQSKCGNLIIYFRLRKINLIDLSGLTSCPVLHFSLKIPYTRFFPTSRRRVLYSLLPSLLSENRARTGGKLARYRLLISQSVR